MKITIDPIRVRELVDQALAHVQVCIRLEKGEQTEDEDVYRDVMEQAVSSGVVAGVLLSTVMGDSRVARESAVVAQDLITRLTRSLLTDSEWVNERRTEFLA